MQSKEAILSIFKKHGNEAIYITNTGYNSRQVYNLFKENKNILYMQGSMGLSPSIGLGIALNTKKDVVVFVGDASLLMHLGVTHTISECDVKNLYVYVLDNGCHESVGKYPCAKLLDSYPGITEVIKVSCDGKTERVKLECQENIEFLKEHINV